MAMGAETGAYFTSNATTGVTSLDKFIPELWSDEVIAAYVKSKKMSPLVRKYSMVGKKGDTIHVPKPTRGTAHAKTEGVAVTMQANIESELVITIDQHFEYSKLIEDFAEKQALASARQFYTQDAGEALALQVDTDLINVFTGMGNGTRSASPTVGDWVHSHSYYFNGTTGLSTYAANTVATGDNFTDIGFREAIKILDDLNVPMEDRKLVIPPAARKTIMGLERYVSSDFRDTGTVSSGLIGNVYGVDIYISSNAPVLATAGDNTASSLATRGCLFFHKDAVIHAEQLGVRSQTQYKQEYLATLYTADTIYGVEAYRPENGLVLAIADE